MKYAKLTNDKQLSCASNSVQLGGNVIFNPTPAQYKKAGYKELIITEPGTKEFYNPLPKYRETKTRIIVEWDYVKAPEPDYKSIVVDRIRGKYSADDEFSLQRKARKNPQDPKVIQYDEYVAECIQLATEEIERYNNA